MDLCKHGLFFLTLLCTHFFPNIIHKYFAVKKIVQSSPTCRKLLLSYGDNGHDRVKRRTAKEKRITTDNPLVEICLEGVVHLHLHVENKGHCRHCKKSFIRNFCGKYGV
ncbi:hypothetical protein RF11_01997 [Thelohanellus kitauei]|uniref:Secreted protein n=1 Tax=Thelohanellus kitauei TaxID=669202 RepID=A0A0C2MLA2_THEKT|nr:hypothetical protein RF11_01997 [Thelohanellus kitauei]